jgi:hypothetical protein
VVQGVVDDPAELRDPRRVWLLPGSGAARAHADQRDLDPVLPSVTLSAGPLGARIGRGRRAGRGGRRAGACAAASATVTDAVAWVMKSRRFRGGVMARSPGAVPMNTSRRPDIQEAPRSHIESNRAVGRDPIPRKWIARRCRAQGPCDSNRLTSCYHRPRPCRPSGPQSWSRAPYRAKPSGISAIVA